VKRGGKGKKESHVHSNEIYKKLNSIKRQPEKLRGLGIDILVFKRRDGNVVGHGEQFSVHGRTEGPASEGKGPVRRGGFGF